MNINKESTPVLKLCKFTPFQSLNIHPTVLKASNLLRASLLGVILSSSPSVKAWQDKIVEDPTLTLSQNNPKNFSTPENPKRNQPQLKKESNSSPKSRDKKEKPNPLDVQNAVNNIVRKKASSKDGLRKSHSQENPTSPKEDKNTGELVFNNATITTYNPLPWQTDSTPCINESSQGVLKKLYGHNGDLCKLHEVWIRVAALPQDRLNSVYRALWTPIPEWKITFDFWDKIRIESNDPRCTWVYIVADAFNKRYNGQEKVDLFRVGSLKTNFSCYNSKVYKM